MGDHDGTVIAVGHMNEQFSKAYTSQRGWNGEHLDGDSLASIRKSKVVLDSEHTVKRVSFSVFVPPSMTSLTTVAQAAEFLSNEADKFLPRL